MLINSIELEKLGYSKQKAHDLSNQLCNALGYTTKQTYIDIVRKGKATTQYQNLRSVESEAVVRMCEEKIKLGKTNKQVNVGQWQTLKDKLENILQNT